MKYILCILVSIATIQMGCNSELKAEIELVKAELNNCRKINEELREIGVKLEMENIKVK